MKKIIKIILKNLFRLSAIVYPYICFLKLTNANDEITILNSLLTAIYCIVTVNLFDWCFEENGAK